MYASYTRYTLTNACASVNAAVIIALIAASEGSADQVIAVDENNGFAVPKYGGRNTVAPLFAGTAPSTVSTAAVVRHVLPPEPPSHPVAFEIALMIELPAAALYGNAGISDAW